jgi:hypothetical protein
MNRVLCSVILSTTGEREAFFRAFVCLACLSVHQRHSSNEFKPLSLENLPGRPDRFPGRMPPKKRPEAPDIDAPRITLLTREATSQTKLNLAAYQLQHDQKDREIQRVPHNPGDASRPRKQQRDLEVQRRQRKPSWNRERENVGTQ